MKKLVLTALKLVHSFVRVQSTITKQYVPHTMCIFSQWKWIFMERNKWHLLLTAQTVHVHNCYFHSCQYFTDTQNIPTHMCVKWDTRQ